MQEENEDNTAMVLKGATYEEAIQLVDHLDLSDKSITEIADLVDPILKKYGWNFSSIIKETIERKGLW